MTMTKAEEANFHTNFTMAAIAADLYKHYPILKPLELKLLLCVGLCGQRKQSTWTYSEIREIFGFRTVASVSFAVSGLVKKGYFKVITSGENHQFILQLTAFDLPAEGLGRGISYPNN